MARPTKELQLTRNKFYELMAERLPRCLEILDEHLQRSALRPEQRWAVETIFEKLLPTLVASPAAHETLADALSDIFKQHGDTLKDVTENPEPGVVDAEVLSEGEAKHALVPRQE